MHLVIRLTSFMLLQLLVRESNVKEIVDGGIDHEVVSIDVCDLIVNFR